MASLGEETAAFISIFWGLCAEEQPHCVGSGSRTAFNFDHPWLLKGSLQVQR